MKKPYHGLVFPLWIALTILGCGGSEGTGPDLSLVGKWDFIGFSDGGVDATTTGSMEFRVNGTVSIIGTITFPGEPLDSIVADGTYQHSGNSVVLAFNDDPGSAWTPSLIGEVLLLTEVEPPPQNVIKLRRQ